MNNEDDHINRMNEAFFLFVDRVITLSTGSLALSITFRSSFSQATPVASYLLKVSWIAFVIAVLAALILILGHAEVHKRSAVTHRQGMDMPAPERPKSVIVSPAWWFVCAKWIICISFLIGIIALAAFAIRNLP